MRLTHGVLAALVGIGLIVSLAPASGGAVTAPRWEPTALCAEPGYRPPAAERATILLPDPSGDGVWTSFPAPTTTPNRICAAIIDDYVNNKIYMAGGTEAGQAGAELSNFQRFDPITNSWQNMASMPAGRTWIDGQGSFIARLGKIYICCGMTGSGISNNNCWEYDIANNTWATRATAPTGQLAYASGVWRDSLIYIMGGYGSGSGSNGVQIYNPFTNAWTTGTAMPENGDMGSACIIGDTIYVTNFYNRASNALWANARKGAINPANPTQITWSTWTSVPSYGFNGGTAALGNKVYRLGGFSTLYVGSDHLRGWVYDPRMGTSESLPWLPYPTPYRRGLSRCNFLVGCERTNELMVSGGDEYGDWSAPNNYYYRNQFTPPHNITCYAILTPSGAVDSGQALVPTLVVRNSGAYTENYKAFMSLPGGYMDTVEQTGVPGGRTDTLTFTPWIPQGRDSMATLAYTTCDNDSFYGDDTLRNRFLVRVKDVAVTAILNPVADTLDSGVVVWPRASVWNYGNQTQSFPLQFRIGTYLSTASVVNLIPGGQQEIVAPESLVTMPGIYIHQVTAVVAGDLHPENNVKTDTFVVRGTVQHNIAATMLIAPVGAYDTTMTVVPACSVANLGTVTEQFWTFLYVREPGGSIVYSESTQTMLGAGGRLRLQFNPVKFTTIGVHSVVCSTYCFGDQNGLDDIIRSTFRVFAELAGDVGVVQILQPPSSVDTNTVITPTAKWRNYYTEAMTFTGYCILINPAGGRPYVEETTIVDLAPSTEITVAFPDYNVGMDTGDWVCRCSTYAPGDTVTSNDVLEKAFRVIAGGRPPWPYGWVEVQSVPSGAKAVKDGGWLTIEGDGGLIYAARGTKTPDFFSYDATADSDGVWTALAAWPNGTEGKAPYKGAVGVHDGSGFIYATKGNGTLGFWRYSADSMAWRQMPDVPLGVSMKKVKGGTDMVYVQEGDTGYVYLLKGYKQDFFRFNTVSGVWDTNLPVAPAGSRPKWDKGSWMAYDGMNTFYAHKAKYHELWPFDVTTHTWASSALPGMPLVGMIGKSKKSKDGGCGAYYEGALYALKGGNTQEWWKYQIDSASWRELDTIPSFGSTAKKKRVKAGGDVVSYGGGYFFALKGNKTLEFWRYGEAPPAFGSWQPTRGGAAAEPVAGRTGLAVVPNPLTNGWAAVRYALPAAGPVRISVYDVTGRSVAALSLVAGRSGSAQLDLRHLSAGVYLVKLQSQGMTAAQKLIVQ